MISKVLSRTLLSILCLFLHTAQAMDASTEADELDDKLFFEQLNEQLYSDGFVEAAQNNHYARVQELLAQGADVNVQKVESRLTPLIAACMHKDDTLPLVTLLLNTKANPKLADNRLNTSLHYAAARNRVAVLELLKKAGALLDAQNSAGSTACHLATESDALETIGWLRRAGARMNMLDTRGQAPIHQAILKGSVATIHQLLNHGASLYVASNTAQEPTDVPAGSTSFHLVARNTSEQGQILKNILLYYALFYGSKFEQTGILDGHSLRARVESLKALFKQKDSNNNTPYDIEQENHASTKSFMPLFKDTLDLDMFNFNEALRKKSLEKLPSSNLFKAAYEAMPKKQGWGSYFLGWLW